MMPPLCRECSLYATFSLVAGGLNLTQGDPDTIEIYCTPGLRIILTRAWSLLLAEGMRYHDALQQVTVFLRPTEDASRRLPYLEEFLEGAGTTSHLASLVIMDLGRYVHQLQSSDLIYLYNLIAFVTDNRDHIPFQDALLYHGVVGVFTRAACAIYDLFNTGSFGFDPGVANRESLARHLFQWIWLHLSIQFTRRPNAYRMIKEAIRAGLFRAIVASAPNNTHNTGPAIIVDLLGPHTVYHSVLSCIGPALRDVKDLHTVSAFMNSGLFKRWT
ncbi:hypothetical protein C8R43DRAFT_602415 [Mycena crocata]|nr:hypothetical protein C8R43DRAFT_602415 [Mycena crocata]